MVKYSGLRLSNAIKSAPEALKSSTGVPFPVEWEPMRRIALFFCCLMAACAPQPVDIPAQTPTGLAAPTTAATVRSAAPTEAVDTLPAPTDAPSPVPSPTLPAPDVCSPLQDIPFDALNGMISNPYHPPKPGYDDPHAGIDLAVLLPGGQVAVSGHPVQAVMDGRVAMVSIDRFPFGNALIIETPLDSLPPAWQTAAGVPTPAPTLAQRSALTCPPYPGLTASSSEKRSLYTLYAHLQEAPAWSPGDSVACGQRIGSIGQSGNALNPHLHYETRVAPSGIQLAPIAHYDSSASAEEMSAYCLWSVSGLFQLVDPQRALGILPAQ